MPKATIALVTGCFDLLHYGHFKFLNFAKSKADTLIVAVESDTFLKKHKGTSRPLFSQKIRKYCLEQVKSVDQVLSLPSHPNYLKLLQKVKPDYLVISSNDSNYKEKHQICQQLGIKLIVFPRLKNYSTTKIISSDISEFH
ncbi:MAG: adenylyltransferase/cytidyltransferase family protein [Candidatus Shapirobacteria bacterium]|jgi:D-beta-D-heptose 7-phosphate kinase/D-beta-D-heptose 1-phosphate adenosyltransferase